MLCVFQRVHDDDIVDYCDELKEFALACGGKTTLLSSDVNCCVKVEFKGMMSTHGV